MNRNTRLVAVLAVALLAATVASFVVYRALAAGSGPQQPQTIDTLVAAQVDSRRHDADPRPRQGRAVAGLVAAGRQPQRSAEASWTAAPSSRLPPTSRSPRPSWPPMGAGAGLPPTIPPGMRAMSVRVNEVVGVAGFVVPGTRVDVLVTFESRTQASESVARVVVSTSRCSPPAPASTRRRRARTTGRSRPRS